MTVVAHGIGRPWGLLPLPDGDFLVSVRATGEVLAIRKGVLDPKPLTGLPTMRLTRTTGMLDMALHPKFAENKWIYFTYHKPLPASAAAPAAAAAPTAAGAAAAPPATPYTLALARGQRRHRFRMKDLYVGNAVKTRAARVSCRPDSDSSRRWRRPDARRRPAPSTAKPSDSKTTARSRPTTVYRKSWRGRGLHHRPSRYHGIAVYPRPVESGANSPLGGDKINILKPGANYGWPTFGYGRDNDGSPMPPPGEGIDPAWITWNPGITPSGLLFYTGDKFPAWKGNLFVGSIQRGRIPGTGNLERVVFNDKLWELRRETILQDFHQRSAMSARGRTASFISHRGRRRRGDQDEPPSSGTVKFGIG